MSRGAIVLAAALLLTGCEGSQDPAPAPSEAPAAALGQAKLPPQVGDYPALASKDCAEVVGFYLEALSTHEYAQAALVWDDPVIDAARLEAVFGSYKQAQVEWTEPFVEGAAGSLYCTVSGKLTDADDPAKPLREGTLLLRRANDVPGATPDQLRWTLQSSTFVENLERSGRGEP
jgi:hypothetical protein